MYIVYTPVITHTYIYMYMYTVWKSYWMKLPYTLQKCHERPKKGELTNVLRLRERKETWQPNWCMILHQEIKCYYVKGIIGIISKIRIVLNQS